MIVRQSGSNFQPLNGAQRRRWNGGAVLVRQPERRAKITECVAVYPDDHRWQKSCRHALESLLRQEVWGPAMRRQDLNDHHAMRKGPGIQTAAWRFLPAIALWALKESCLQVNMRLSLCHAVK